MINCKKWMLTNTMKKYLVNILKRSSWSYLGVLKKKLDYLWYMHYLIWHNQLKLNNTNITNDNGSKHLIKWYYESGVD